MPYINFNGNIFPEHEALLPVTNRSFRYGDGFFETLAMFNKRFPLLEYHWSRIEFTAQVISAYLPSRLDMEKLQGMLLDLASVNDAAQNARFRVQFYRKGSGLFLPVEDELGYAIAMEKLENTKFEAGDGLKAGMRDDCYKAISMVSDIKNSSALPYVLAAQFAKAEGWDDCILTNHYGQVCESLNSNIFIVKGHNMVTPDLDSACVNGVMRSYLLGSMEGEIEEREMDVSELIAADEILLTNAVKGVQWVKEFKGKTYGDKKAQELTAFLNKNLLDV
ncbi:MAG TPA: aminotransferase class IV [Chitinophagales bacterium]|nr:aminotransferase class IV [Chitinophagales bacterium]